MNVTSQKEKKMDDSMISKKKLTTPISKFAIVDDTTIVRYLNEDLYCGGLKDYMRHGPGLLIYANRQGSYTGDWRNNQKHGYGIERVNGYIYSGMWKYNSQHGKGTMVDIDGITYEGTWIRNKKEGKGTLRYPDGNIIHVIWKHDIMY